MTAQTPPGMTSPGGAPRHDGFRGCTANSEHVAYLPASASNGGSNQGVTVHMVTSPVRGPIDADAESDGEDRASPLLFLRGGAGPPLRSTSAPGK